MSQTDPMAHKRQSNALLWLVAIGFFMEILDSTIVNTAIPSMARSLKVSPLSMQSVIVAYSLTLAVLIPASGWISDRFGTRKVFFTAIAVFTAGSLCCSLSTSLAQIVSSRVLQGLGGSMMLPVGRLAVLRAYPGEKYLTAIAFISMPALFGPMIGPTLGGWLVQYASWHWIFLVNIPVGVAGCIATYLTMPVGDPIPQRRFDGLGFGLLSTAMVGVSIAMDGYSELGLAPMAVAALVAFAVGCLAAYVSHARRAAEPLFPLSLFEITNYRVGIQGNLVSRMGSSGIPFLVPLYLQLVLHDKPLVAGMSMIPIALAAILAKRVIPWMIHRLGYRTFLMANTWALGGTIASFSLISAAEPMWLRIAQLFLFGMLNSMQFTSMNTATLKDLEPNLAGQGSTMFSMVQMVAMSFGVAISGVLLVSFRAHFGITNAFVATFLSLGGITVASSLIFRQMAKQGHSSLLPQITFKSRSPRALRGIAVRRRAQRIFAASKKTPISR